MGARRADDARGGGMGGELFPDIMRSYPSDERLIKPNHVDMLIFLNKNF